jgi:hypothetical protein
MFISKEQFMTEKALQIPEIRNSQPVPAAAQLPVPADALHCEQDASTKSIMSDRQLSIHGYYNKNNEDDDEDS